MNQELLLDIGLTKSEIAVYLALLEIGSSTTGPIIKKAGIASGKAYIILDRLATKGLVTYAQKGGVKYYQAKDPERLLDYIREKESELKNKEKAVQKLLPLLRQRYEQRKNTPLSEIYEGANGFKTFFEFLLKEAKKGDEILALGVPLIVLEKFDSYLVDWNKRRIKLGISVRIIYNHNCVKYGRKREKMRLTEVRYTSPELETPAWIEICRDNVTTINVHGIPICFLIKNQEAADTYRKYFDFIWKQAKKI